MNVSRLIAASARYRRQRKPHVRILMHGTRNTVTKRIAPKNLIACNSNER